MSAQSKIAIFLFLTTIIFAVLFFTGRSGASQSEVEHKERIAVAKERIRLLEAQSTKNRATIDSLFRVGWRLDSLLAVQNRNEELIHKKYNVKRNQIRTLPADSAIRFFSTHVRPR